MSINSAVESPLELLENLAAQTMGDKAMAAKVEAAATWRGFAFSVGGLNLAFPFMGGFEILPDRDIQPVPWSQHWVTGITNVRGEIYSVVDFSNYLGLPPVSSLRNATLFMLPDRNLKSALLLDSRVNLKTFPEYLEHVDTEGIPERLKRCTSATLKEGQDIWYVVDVKLLCLDSDYIDIGLSE